MSNGIQKKKLIRGLIFSAYILLIASIAGAQSNPVQLLNSLPIRVGDTLILKTGAFENNSRVVLEHKEYESFGYNGEGRVVIPLPYTLSPGAYTLRYQSQNKEEFLMPINIASRKSRQVELPVPKSLNVKKNKLGEMISKQNTQLTYFSQGSTGPVLFTSAFGLPLLENRELTSLYGEIRRTGHESIRHLGIDIAAHEGKEVYAINSGRVRAAYADTLYGNTVVLNHGAEISSLYMHLHSIAVVRGQKIRKGQRIGTVGTSGLASGPHLHLSVKVRGTSVDPLQFVRDFK